MFIFICYVAKEILLYGSIYNYSVQGFVNGLEENKNEDVCVRINSSGGSVEDSWSAIAKFSEHKKKKSIKVDGKAYSMALYFLCYADNAEGFDVSQFLLHRAAYNPYWESSNEITESDWAQLNAINAKLRAAFEAKCDVKKFEKITGKTLDEVFSNEGRIDVILTAEQALEIGLISKINQLTPEKANEINAFVDTISNRIAAHESGMKLNVSANQTESINQNKNSKNMTLLEFKASHPALYAEAVNEGVAQERDRVEAFMVFNDIDPEAVGKAISDGKPLTAKLQAEFTRKSISKGAIVAIQEEAAPAVNTPTPAAVAQTPAEKEIAEFEAQVDKELNLKK